MSTFQYQIGGYRGPDQRSAFISAAGANKASEPADFIRSVARFIDGTSYTIHKAVYSQDVDVLNPGFTGEVAFKGVIIKGKDVAGWTLDGYVLPRLASGLYFGEEL